MPVEAQVKGSNSVPPPPPPLNQDLINCNETVLKPNSDELRNVIKQKQSFDPRGKLVREEITSACM